MAPGSATVEELARPLLAIDTSSAQGALALYDGRSLSFRSWAAERSHTTTLLSEIHHLLEEAEVEIPDLGAIGIAVGPGGFTSLRVGFGVAKGLHLATGTPLIGISTLEATALPFAQSGRIIVATVGAGRARLVWAHYAPVDEGVVEVRPPRNGTAPELAAELEEDGPHVVAGELDAEQAAILCSVADVAIPPKALRFRHPAAFAEILWRRWRAQSFDDATLLEPIYLARSASVQVR